MDGVRKHLDLFIEIVEHGLFELQGYHQQSGAIPNQKTMRRIVQSSRFKMLAEEWSKIGCSIENVKDHEHLTWWGRELKKLFADFDI